MSDPESVLTDKEREMADGESQCTQPDGCDHWLDAGVCNHSQDAFSHAIERLVRGRLAERINAAEQQTISDYGLSLGDVLAIIRGKP